MKKLLLGVMCMLLVGAMMTGCFSEEKKAEIKNKVHAAILTYVESQGQEKAIEYIDKLVAEGKLGTANADKLKAALPLGIDKLKGVMLKEEEAAPIN